MRANTLDAKALEIDGQGASGGSNPNLLINGQFDIWQRGTSFVSLSKEYTADRWRGYNQGITMNIYRQSFTVGQTDVPGGPTYYLRVELASAGSAASDVCRVDHKVEDVAKLAEQTWTLSFWAKVTSGTADLAVGWLQGFDSAGGGSAFVAGHIDKTTLTTSWQKIVMTFDLPSISGKTIGSGGITSTSTTIQFFMSAGSDFNTRTDTLGFQTGTFDFAQVKLEKGSVATPFQPSLIGEELALCERYYEVGDASFTGRSPVAQVTWRINTEFRTTKRTTPSVTFTSVTTSGVSTKQPNNISTTNFEYQFIITTTSNAVARDTWAADAEL